MTVCHTYILAKEAEFYAKSICSKTHCQGNQKLFHKKDAYSFQSVDEL